MTNSVDPDQMLHCLLRPVCPDILCYYDNLSFRLTVGVENSLFHFQYFDNLEGVFVCSDKETSGASPITKQISEGFHKCCKQIKHTFDAARKIKVHRSLFYWFIKAQFRISRYLSLGDDTK